MLCPDGCEDQRVLADTLEALPGEWERSADTAYRDDSAHAEGTGPELVSRRSTREVPRPAQIGGRF